MYKRPCLFLQYPDNLFNNIQVMIKPLHLDYTPLKSTKYLVCGRVAGKQYGVP